MGRLLVGRPFLYADLCSNRPDFHGADFQRAVCPICFDWTYRAGGGNKKVKT